jgi:SAM-dependent methyltransferase
MREAPRHYSPSFVQYAARSSSHSAKVITAYLSNFVPIRSVLDVGCASGTWLRAWTECGAELVYGIDGDWVDREVLEIPLSSFAPVDLTGGFDLGRKFDLVQSLEVAEHIHPDASEVFIDNLTNHARLGILFSAAPPGQGGEYHVNERPYDYWREMFGRRGFTVLDCVRPHVIDDKHVSYWYRYNTFLYVRPEVLTRISPQLTSREVPMGSPLQDISPVAFRIRKSVVKHLPYTVQRGIADLKARFVPTGRF